MESADVPVLNFGTFRKLVASFLRKREIIPIRIASFVGGA